MTHQSCFAGSPLDYVHRDSENWSGNSWQNMMVDTPNDQQLKLILLIFVFSAKGGTLGKKILDNFFPKKFWSWLTIVHLFRGLQSVFEWRSLPTGNIYLEKIDINTFSPIMWSPFEYLATCIVPNVQVLHVAQLYRWKLITFFSLQW